MFSHINNAFSRKYRQFPPDLLVILIWTVSASLFVLIPFLNNTVIRTILGVPMVLFIPGYVLVSALFPKKDELETVPRIALSFGLSIAIIPLLGLLLNITSGIRLVPILLALCAYTISLAFAAAYIREKLPEKERFSVSFDRLYEIVNGISGNSRTDRFLTVFLIFCLVLAMIITYSVIVTPMAGERFTEFYILDPSGKSDNYPLYLKNNSNAEITAGVVNHEYASVNYTIRVKMLNSVLSSISLRLGHNETWEKNISFVPVKEGTDMKLEFLLFKEDNFTAPYRDLHLWVNVTK